MRPKRIIENPGLSRGLIVAVIAALLPVAVLSLIQALSAREYANQLIRERLVASAAASAQAEREVFNRAQRVVAAYARDPDVLGVTAGCSVALGRWYDRSARAPIVSLYRWDAQGKVLCGADGHAAGSVTPNLPPEWWDAQRDGKFRISPPFLAQPENVRAIAAIQPLRAASGQPAGAITARIDLTSLERGLRDSRLSREAVAIIVNARGDPVIASGRTPFERFPVAAALGKAVRLSGLGEWLYSASPLVEGQLYLVYAEPGLPIFATTRNHLYVSLAVPLLAVILGSMALWLAVRRLVIRWLRELTGVADSLRRGDYSDQRERFAKAPGELAQLGEDLHDMADAIRRRDDSLTAAADRNLALAREVNHRVKNNLQIVVSLISMQRANIRDEAAKLALEQTRARVAGIGLIHQLLYDEEPGELGQVDMSRLMSGLCEQFTNDFDAARADLECEAGEGAVPIDQAVPLTLFIIEAVTNAYRHGFPKDRRGRIRVELRREGDTGCVSVRDDGIGYDRDTAGMTTGVALMQAYAVQLHGEMKLETEPGGGVALELRFPIKAGEG
ncbi:MAG: sensor histidine kinase [Novosphingobium sp.]